jgi:hypothetical protein
MKDRAVIMSAVADEVRKQVRKQVKTGAIDIGQIVGALQRKFAMNAGAAENAIQMWSESHHLFQGARHANG